MGLLDEAVLMTYDKEDSEDHLAACLAEADFIYHLAGMNRPQREEEFALINAGITQRIVDLLTRARRNPSIVFASSTQALLDNPYGKSKKAAEDILIDLRQRCDNHLYIFRLPGVFGRWSRPNYNTVVATFCHNIAHDLDISISDPNREMELVYIDDVIRCFIDLLSADINYSGNMLYEIDRSFKVTLGEMAQKIYGFRQAERQGTVPELPDLFSECLYNTYQSFIS